MLSDCFKLSDDNFYLVSAFKALLEVMQETDDETYEFLNDLELLNNPEITTDFIISKLSYLNQYEKTKIVKVLAKCNDDNQFLLHYHDFVYSLSQSKVRSYINLNQSKLSGYRYSSDGSGSDKSDIIEELASSASSTVHNHNTDLLKSTKNLSKENKIIQGLYEVLKVFKKESNLSIWDIFWLNQKYKLSYYLKKVSYNLTPNRYKTKQAEEGLIYVEHRYKYYRLLYTLINYGLIINTDYILSLIPNPKASNDLEYLKSLDKLNEYIADLISFNAPNLKYYHKKQLKKLYSKWSHSITDYGIYQRHFIYREFKPGYSRDKKPDHTQYEINRLTSLGRHSMLGVNLRNVARYPILTYRKNTIWQKILCANGYLAIILSSIALGLVPAVLTASVTGSLLSCLVFIALPSILINIILYKKPVKEFIKDIINNRLLKNKSGDYIALSIPLFLVSLCGGLTYGAMAFSSCLEAFNCILIYLFPSIVLAPVTLFYLVGVISLILSVYTLVAYTALFFGSMIDVVRQGVLNEISGYFNKNIHQAIRQDAGVFYKIINLSYAVLKPILLLSATAYLTFMETALLFSAASAILPSVPLALGLVLIAAPANLLFTFKVYNFLIKQLAKLPQHTKLYFNQLVDNDVNNVTKYEVVKHILVDICSVFALFLYARDSGQGFVSGLKDQRCSSVTNILPVSPNNAALSRASYITEVGDAFGAAFEGFKDTLKPSRGVFYLRNTHGADITATTKEDNTPISSDHIAMLVRT